MSKSLEKAREIVKQWEIKALKELGCDKLSIECWSDKILHDLIATALDQARNEALEEAASLLEKSNDRDWVSNCAYELRALITSPNESKE